MQFKCNFTLLAIVYTTGSTAGAPKTMLCSEGNAASDIDSFRDILTLYINSTICIHLNDIKWAFSWVGQISSHFFTGNIQYMVETTVL